MLKTLILGAFAAKAARAEEAVITGTEANFDDLIKTNKNGVLVEFYAPWCGHCKKIAPEYESAAQKLKSEGIEIPLVKVDATVESKIAERFSVGGYPTLKWFVGGNAAEYDGPREADGIVKWIKSMTGAAVTESAPTGDEVFSVTFTGKDLTAFEEVAKANRKAAAWHFVKSDKAGELVISHTGEEPIKVTTDSQTEMETAFKKNSFPLFGALDGETFSKYMQEGSGMIWTLLPMTADTVSSVVEEKRSMMTEIAKEMSGSFTVTWTNTVEFGKVLESMFGLTEFPKIVVQTKVGDKKNFIYNGELTKDAILEYVKKVQSGEIKPDLKSEEPPAEPQTDPVKVVTGKTVETLVFDAKKDVLLEVYAPWCGHCKKIEPEYIKVGKKVQKEGFEDILTIAKMDGTLNDSPVDSISWSGFPTLYYIKAGSTEPTKYEGPRDAKGIWKWLKKNHSQAEMIKEKIAAKLAAKKEEGGSTEDKATEETPKEEL